MCKKTQGSQIKGKSQLNSLCEAMGFMTNKFEEYEWEWQEKDKTVDSMKSDMINMNERIEKLERILDDKSNTHIAIASHCAVLHKVNVKTLMI